MWEGRGSQRIDQRLQDRLSDSATDAATAGDSDVCSSVLVHLQITLHPESNSMPSSFCHRTSPSITDYFQSTFTVVLYRKFAIKLGLSLNIPRHLRRVATLPCEMLMSENHLVLFFYVKLQLLSDIGLLQDSAEIFSKTATTHKTLVF